MGLVIISPASSNQYDYAYERDKYTFNCHFILPHPATSGLVKST